MATDTLRTSTMKHRSWFLAGAIGAFLQLAVTNTLAQTWDYKVATKGGGTPGSVTLEQQDGKPIVRMLGRLNNCWSRQALKAHVSKTEDLTTITVEPALLGCDEIRFVIKNDGTGGKRQVKQGGEWVDDGFDRGLTLRK